jgi:hypothetical protein
MIPDDAKQIVNIDSQLQERFRLTWAGCLGGAILEESYWHTMRKAGFTEFQIVSRHSLTPMELKAMACCPGEEFTTPPSSEDLKVVEGKVDSVKLHSCKATFGLIFQSHSIS